MKFEIVQIFNMHSIYAYNYHTYIYIYQRYAKPGHMQYQHLAVEACPQGLRRLTTKKIHSADLQSVKAPTASKNPQLSPSDTHMGWLPTQNMSIIMTVYILYACQFAFSGKALFFYWNFKNCFETVGSIASRPTREFTARSLVVWWQEF